ncbi:MAG: CaiB/BaiF CoA-transferase family protein [Phycisphaerae bacterium]|jgi:CoA:oxalate CoA-transferase|nr:CaiB/BaiF CoA-transferase family protein [Phycisphaerae bacterium]
MAKKPLDDILVIDLTRVLAGPYCTMILGDLGAEIIKVEAPGVGDDARHFGPFLDDAGEKSAYFASINCGKKSLTLNLKTEQGREVLADLIRKADVLVENYRPGALEKLGFSEQRVKESNPSIIYASSSGFGYSGPDSANAAYDMVIQSLSGLMSITGTEDGRCVRVGSSISDIVSGLYMTIGIVTALFRRSRSSDDRGARIDIAMLDSTVSVLENAIARYQTTGKTPGPLGARHPSITPFEAFDTSDSTIVIAAGNDKIFRSLCEVLGCPEQADDPRFATNAQRTEHHAELKVMINGRLSAETTDHWIKVLEAANVPCAKVNTIEDLFDYEQIKARNMLVPVEGSGDFKVAGSPVKFRGEDEVTSRTSAPELGQHNRQVLSELLGYSEENIRKLYEAGAIAQ